MQKKKEIISPYTLKGKDVLEYTKTLMGINENFDKSKAIKNEDIKLIKEGVNGEVFGLIKENHEYFIKVLKENSQDLSLNNFDYIGGLSNKRDFVYSTYTKAINSLNIHLHEIAYSLGKTDVKINLMENDIINFDNKVLITEEIEVNPKIEVVLDENELMMETLLNNLKDENFLNFGNTIIENVVEDNKFDLSDSYKDIISEEMKDSVGVSITFDRNGILFENKEIYLIKEGESVLTVLNNLSKIVIKKV